MTLADARLGHFWLPQTPATRVAGVLSSDAGGVDLSLLGRLEGQRSPIEPREIGTGNFFDVVHGDLVNPAEAVTVLMARQWIDLFEDNSHVHGRLAIVGSHTDLVDPICRVRFELADAHLVLPVVPGQFSFTRDEHGRNVSRLEAEHVDAHLVTLPFGRMTIHAGVSVTPGLTSRMSVTSRFEFILDPPMGLEHAINDVVVPLRALVSLLRGGRPEISAFEMQGAGDDDPDDPDELLRSVVLARRLEWPSWLSGSPSSELRDFDALRLWHVFEPAPGNPTPTVQTVLAAWWEWYAQNKAVVDAANRSASDREREAADVFADLFAACERYGERYRPLAHEHAAKVERLTSFIPANDADREWAEQVLRSSGGIGLQARLRRLASETAGVDRIMGSNFAREAVAVRSANAHGGRGPALYAEGARRLRAALLLRFSADTNIDPGTVARFTQRMIDISEANPDWT